MSRRIERARVFAALGDATRLRIVRELAPGRRRSIAELTAGSRLTRQAITKHVRVLEGAGLLRGERQGREVRFQLQPAAFTEAQSYLAEVQAQWAAALGRLKAFVEGR
ncbi:MAG TPA: metalloregulator ArsR/SmtB family transcription factor [Opitutaceae bacterium]|jgi:DNA-binding transcriptional ArsR family regulator|nr:metalloregulator ArsR/SmtB family transcription factor [Opitutaceae bacterium]